MTKVALFASGNGSNVENIYNYFENDNSVSISLILTNNSNAFVIERAERLGLPCIIFNRDEFYYKDSVLNHLLNYKIDFIVLAGFLWLVPSKIIENFKNKIINIHPALLPKFGGKGMYGMNVHKAVYNNDEKETGITIHYVNENYDEGDVIFQKKIKIEELDSPEIIAEKVHGLEYKYFPEIIKDVMLYNRDLT